MSKTKSTALILGVFIMSFLVGCLVFAWTEPTQVPPGGNVPAPLNVGTIEQIKAGGLGIVGGFYADPPTLVVDAVNHRVGIGDTTPASLLTVGSGDLFQVNSSGNIVKIRNITYSWPSAQGAANTFLQNNGSGTLSWTTLPGRVANAFAKIANDGGTVQFSASGEDTLRLAAGSGLTIAYDTTTKKVTYSHTDTSSQTNVDNSGNTFIQDISLDTYGHLTGLTSATVSETDPQVGTLTSGKWCTSDGSAVNCTQDAPAGTSFANPTGTIGLTIVNGSATTAMRSDAAPALSQSIIPTWTGIHTFNSTTNFVGDIAKIRNITYSWPSAQGAASTFLQNNGSGILSWTTPAGGGVTSISQGTGMTFSATPITTTGTINLNTAGISTCTNSTTNKIYWDSANGRLACGTDLSSAACTWSGKTYSTGAECCSGGGDACVRSGYTNPDWYDRYRCLAGGTWTKFDTYCGSCSTIVGQHCGW